MAVMKKPSELAGRAEVKLKPIEFLNSEEIAVIAAIEGLERAGQKATFGKIGHKLMDSKFEELSRKEIVKSPKNLRLDIAALTAILGELGLDGYIRREVGGYSLTEYGRRELERYHSKPERYIA